MEARTSKRRGPMSWLAARSWRFWVVVAALMPVFYVVSFGPACWIEADPIPDGGFERVHHPSVVYWPLGALARRTDLPATKWLRRWLLAGVPKDHAVLVPTGVDEVGGFSWPASEGGTVGGVRSADTPTPSTAP